MFADLKKKLAHAQSFIAGLARLSRAYYGMVIAHIGFAVTVLGVCLTSQYSVERDLRMMPGEQLELAGYVFQFQGTDQVIGPNYRGDEGTITVTKGTKIIASLHPQKRIYNAQQDQVMTEAAIDNGFFSRPVCRIRREDRRKCLGCKSTL